MRTNLPYDLLTLTLPHLPISPLFQINKEPLSAGFPLQREKTIQTVPVAHSILFVEPM